MANILFALALTPLMLHSAHIDSNVALSMSVALPSWQLATLSRTDVTVLPAMVARDRGLAETVIAELRRKPRRPPRSRALAERSSDDGCFKMSHYHRSLLTAP